jgi:hypothetical protein
VPGLRDRRRAPPRHHAGRLGVHRLQAHRLAVLIRPDDDQAALDLADGLLVTTTTSPRRARPRRDEPRQVVARPQLGQPGTGRTV